MVTKAIEAGECKSHVSMGLVTRKGDGEADIRGPVRQGSFHPLRVKGPYQAQQARGFEIVTPVSIALQALCSKILNTKYFTPAPALSKDPGFHPGFDKICEHPVSTPVLTSSKDSCFL
jgi:hypothetical protein